MEYSDNPEEIDKAISELDPEIQKLLVKKAYEQWLRILSIVIEGREWFSCFKCERFREFKGKRLKAKNLDKDLRKGIIGYCSHPEWKRPVPLKNVIYMKSETSMFDPCLKPKKELRNDHKNIILDIMLLEENDKLSKMLEDSSLSEAEREYFTKLKKTILDSLRNC